MKYTTAVLFFFSASLIIAPALSAQGRDRQGGGDHGSASVGRGRQGAEAQAPLSHPYHIEARHPRPGCDDTAACGELYYTYDGRNMRTSAGTTWQSQIMADTSTPTVNSQCNFIGLTNTAITPAEADTTLSGEFVTNGFNAAGTSGAGVRANAYADNSTTLTVPGAPTTVVTGTTGTAVFYYIFACNQGICTTVGAASASTSVASTLNATNYVTVTWTGSNGPAIYKVIRTNSGTPPTGSLAGGSTLASSGEISADTPGCTAALVCSVVDSSNTIAAFTVPSSNLTNFGKFTIAKTYTSTANAVGVQAFGIFTANASGTMCFEGTFTPATMNTNDTLAVSEVVYF